jgi:hypothetical protein
MSHLLPTYSASVGTAMAPKVLGSADLDKPRFRKVAASKEFGDSKVFFWLENYNHGYKVVPHS